MNSTNTSPDIAEIRRVYREEILPLARKMRAEEKLFFAISKQSEKSTYYVPRKKITVTSADFETIDINSVEDFKTAFVELWISQGYPELSTLAGSLVGLARIFHETEQQSENVSASIYIMF